MPHTVHVLYFTIHSQSAISGTTPTTCTHNMLPVSKAGRWGDEAASPHMHSALSHMRSTQCTMSPVQRAGCGEAVLPAHPACTLLVRAVAAGGGASTSGAAGGDSRPCTGSSQPDKVLRRCHAWPTMPLVDLLRCRCMS